MQELEETAYWLEMLEGAKFCGRDQLEPLTNEAEYFSEGSTRDSPTQSFFWVSFSNRLMSWCPLRRMHQGSKGDPAAASRWALRSQLSCPTGKARRGSGSNTDRSGNNRAWRIAGRVS